MADKPTGVLAGVETGKLSEAAKAAVAPATAVVALWEVESLDRAVMADPKEKCEELRDVFLATGTDAKNQLIALWPSREAFQREKAKLAAHLALGTAPLVAELWQPWPARKPLWKKLKLSQWLLGLVAFLGGLEALRSYFLTLSATPDLRLAVTKWEPDVVQGKAIAGAIEVTNALLTGQRISKVEIALARQGESREATSVFEHDLGYQPVLESGGRTTVAFSGTAEHAGVYSLTATFHGHAGILRWSGKDFTLQQKKKVRVWPDKPKLREILEGKGIPDQRSIKAIFEIGPATSLECRVCLPEGRTITNPRLLVQSGDLSTPEVGLVGNRCAKWTQGAVSQFTEYNIRLLFGTTPATTWTLDGIEATCESRTP